MPLDGSIFLYNPAERQRRWSLRGKKTVIKKTPVSGEGRRKHAGGCHFEDQHGSCFSETYANLLCGICLSSFNSLADRIHKLKWGNQKQGLTWFFCNSFLIRGSILTLEAGLCLWWAVFVGFLHSFFTVIASMFLAVWASASESTCRLLTCLPSWFAQALICVNFNTSDLINFQQLLGLPCERYDTFSSILGTYRGHHGPLLSFFAVWEWTPTTCPASSVPSDKLEGIT